MVLYVIDLQIMHAWNTSVSMNNICWSMAAIAIATPDKMYIKSVSNEGT